jgi:MFS family permease
MLALRTAGYTIGWAAINMILIKRLGLETLPYSFILFASFSLTGAVIYLFFADALPGYNLIRIFSIGTGILLIISVFFIPEYKEHIELDMGLILFAFLILTGEGIGYSITSIQIWTLINDAFRPDEGTRFYPLIAMAPSLGSITGGLILRFFGDNLHVESLIIWWALLVMSVLPLLSILQRYYGKEIDSQTGYLKNISRNLISNFKDGFKFLFYSPLLQSIALICILFWLVASLKEFQFDKILNQHFTTEGDLNKFYGVFTIVLRSCVLIIQILFTGRIIRFTGAGYGLCILPAAIFICLASILISSSFYCLVIMRFTWDLLGMTVQITAFQLSFNAVSGPYRGRARGILEGLVNPIGGILGGLFIIFINRIFYSNPDTITSHRVIITVMALIFSLLWIVTAIIVNKRYRETIVQNLNSDDRRTCLDAIEMLRDVKKSVALEKLHKLLDTDDMEVKNTALKTISIIQGKRIIS